MPGEFMRMSKELQRMAGSSVEYPASVSHLLNILLRKPPGEVLKKV
jgi:hypothetical protein